MNANYITGVRIALLLAGIGAFAYSMNSGNDMARWVGIGCVAAALLVRIVTRFTNRP